MSRRSFRFGSTTRGERNPRAKLTEAKVREIFDRVEAGETKVSIAQDLGLHPSTVGDAALRRTWAYGEERSR